MNGEFIEMLTVEHSEKGIKAGIITLQFRRWKKPSVRKGSRIRTAMGVVEITDISETNPENITNDEAFSAGFSDLNHLLDILNSKRDGQVYKIELRYYSEDPRIALRQNTDVGDKDLETIKSKLDRLDRYSKEGSWTVAVLKMIRDKPRVRAADLAKINNREKDDFKINIRKLKNLGLTISHEVGYTLSPLGELVFKTLE